ncbi:PLP-dependent aminotransferase family protein [Nocardioides sp. SYSU DS0651]|uniref:aminotransferase-like domain-containing protein n=1 Tax=Nocardioides sp. SYSU DS0651 TaxID=3415955 RepID=UPI003F4C0FDC
MSDDSSDRILRDLRTWVAAAPPGARLPSSRQLVREHRASPVTVQRALRRLAGLGLVESRPGVGTFVRAVRTPRAADYGWQTAALRSRPHPRASVPAPLRDAPNDVMSLHSGYPDRALLPERLVRAALSRAARSDAAVGRPPAAGLPALQAWFSQQLAELAPGDVVPPAASDVLVVPGSQSGLSSIFRSMVAAGRPVLVESPTYWGAIAAARHAGVGLVPVTSGPAGPDPGELADAFAETGARVFYAQPHFANPTGAVWPAEVAAAVLDVVRAHGAFLVEDDWAHDFAITGAPTPLAARDDGGHVLYLRSLTKSVSPALRVAGLVARGPARERLLADRGAESMYVSGLLQAAALDVVTQPAWATHLRGVRRQLGERRDLLLDALREHVPDAVVEHVPAGGLNLWLRLPDGTDVDLLVREAEQERLLVAAGREWFPAEPAASYVRLSYAGPNPAAFPAAAAALGRALARVSLVR